MFQVIADIMGLFVSWQRAIIFACVAFLIVVLVRRLLGKRLNSMPWIQYLSGFLLACVVGLYASASQLLHLDTYFLVSPDQYTFTIRFFPLTDYLFWFLYLVPIGILIPMTFPKGCGTLRRVLVIVFACSLLVVLLQYKIDPGAFRVLMVLANLVWAALGFKLYDYGRKRSAEKTLDGMAG